MPDLLTALLALALGFVGGFLIAKAVNMLVQTYENLLRRRLQMTHLDPLEATEE